MVLSCLKLLFYLRALCWSFAVSDVIIIIDDLPSVVQGLLSDSNVKLNLFSDNILLNHVIINLADYATSQLAVSSIEAWSISNFLSFNAGKCK